MLGYIHSILMTRKHISLQLVSKLIMNGKLHVLNNNKEMFLDSNPSKVSTNKVLCNTIYRVVVKMLFTFHSCMLCLMCISKNLLLSQQQKCYPNNEWSSGPVHRTHYIITTHVTSSSHHIHQNVSYHHHGSLVICPRITKCFQEIIMHSNNYSSFDLLANKIHQQ